MRWPNHADYSDVIQNPEVCFELPGLQGTSAATNALGLPRALSGNFASVYEVSGGRETFAVRCFIRQVTNQKARYAGLHKYLSRLDLPFMVPFEFIARGIRVDEDWYPIVKMDWVSGDPLHAYVEKNLKQPARIELLSINWRELVRTLEEHEIGHGDLQHGNVLVMSAGQLKLVDYDGVFVPAFAGGKSPELGHPNYQHPLRTPEFYDERLDRFSSLLIYLNLKAVSAEPGLWAEFHTGDNLLVSAYDLRTPQSSKLWPRLLNSPDKEVQKLTVFLTDFLKVPPLNVPDLETILESSIRGIVVPKALMFAGTEVEPLAAQAATNRETTPAREPAVPMVSAKMFEIAGVSAILFALLALIPSLRVIGGIGAILLAGTCWKLPGAKLHYSRGLAALALCVGLVRVMNNPGVAASARNTEAGAHRVAVAPAISSSEVLAAVGSLDSIEGSSATPSAARGGIQAPMIPVNDELQSISLPLVEPVETPVVRPVSSWTAHRHAVSSLAFTGDGQYLVTTAADPILSVWNPRNRSKIHSISNLLEPILSITTLTNAGIFATADRAANLRWWSVDGGIALKQLQLSESSLFPPTLSKDGRLIAIGGDDRRSIALHRDGAAAVSSTLNGFSSWVKAVQFSTDNRRVVVLCYDDTISVRDAQSGRVIQNLSFPDSDIHQIECSLDGRWLAALGSTGRIRVWNIETGKLCANTSLATGGIATGCFSSDGQWIIIGTATGQLHCVFSSNGLVRTPNLDDQSPFTALAISPEADLMATGNSRGEVHLWNADQLVGKSALRMARP